MQAVNIRLPGVYFLPADRPAAPLLPPLDTAAFVGFAERGPLHTPLAVEDADVYEAIFGGDLALARDEGKSIYACLPTAVSTFFANGGRRCYVVRVAADSATPTRLPLTGVVSLDAAGESPRLTPLQTSSPGAWGARLRSGSRLIATPLPAAVFSAAGPLALMWETGSAPLAIQTGDVLKLAFGDECWLFPVTAVSALPAAIAKTPVTIHADRLWPLITAANLAAPLLFDDVARLTLDGAEALSLTANLDAHKGQLHLRLSGDDQGKVSDGDILWLRQPDAPGYLFPVTDLQSLGDWGSPPEPQTLATAVSALSLADDATLPTGSPVPAPSQVDRLRFELSLWDGTIRRPAIREMAFNAGHPRFWGETILLDSSSLRANAPADPEGKQAARAVQLFRQIQAEERGEDIPAELQTIALAGLLAPIEAGDTNRIHLPLGMDAILREDNLTIPDETDIGQNGLEAFDEAYFLDPDLNGVGYRTLLSEAFAKYYVADRRLRGLHSLLFIDEVVQLAMPDAVHHHWAKPVVVPVANVIDLPDPPPPNETTFAACGLPPQVTAVYPSTGTISGGDTVAILGERFDSARPPTIFFGERPVSDVRVVASTMIVCVTPKSAIIGTVPVVLTNNSGTTQLDDAYRYVRSTVTPLPQLPDIGDYRQEALLTLQEAMINFCQARQNTVAILSLPHHYEKRQCIAWQESFRRTLGLPRRRTFNFNDIRSQADLSYAAVYHPWLDIEDSDGSLRAIPPDGAVCGLIAAREQERGVWVAPANQPLQGTLALNLLFTEADWADLFELQFNLIRREARDFRAMSAHTLSDDRLLLQLSVRRLLILLRKTAVQRGLDFVFENNDTHLWDTARLALEAMLQEMFAQGAFAGAAAQEAYRVTTGPDLNTRQRIEQGQFLAQIQVAPSSPMEFITVLLTRTSEGVLSAVEAP